MESSRRDLLNDMAEHRPILNNNQNTHYSRFSFTPKTGTAFPPGVWFLLCAGDSFPRKIRQNVNDDENRRREENSKK